MRVQALPIIFAAAALLAPPASAAERCDIRYSVRLIHPGHNVDTGSEVRAFSTCVSNLTECHTNAEELAREHARETPSTHGARADSASVNVMDIDTADDCEAPQN